MRKISILGYSVAYFATIILQAAGYEILPYFFFSPYSKFPICLNLCAYQAIEVKEKKVNHC